MRKGILVAVLFLLLGGVAAAEVQVLFLPESGFLRVHGEVVMVPASPSPSFMLFPGAQITELWAEELAEYAVQRGVHGTMVSLSLRHVRPQLLTFSYEGFLDLEGAELFLDRNTLWFPEFSFAIENAQINANLPANWEVVEWQSEPPLYPSFTVRDTTATVAEAPIPVALPIVDEFFSRVQMQVTRLTNAMNHRNATEIETLLSPSLRETGLASYLATLPPSYGQVKGELQDLHTAILTTDRGLRYQASMVWQEQEGRLELQSFQLRPHGPVLPEELLGSMQEFVRALRLVVQAQDREGLLLYVDPNITQGQVEVVEFLLSMNATVPWSVEHAVLDPFTITVLVSHSESTKFLLNIGLTPGEHHWLIRRIDVVPVG